MTDRLADLKQDVETAVSITKSGNGDERKIVIHVRPEKEQEDGAHGQTKKC